MGYPRVCRGAVTDALASRYVALHGQQIWGLMQSRFSGLTNVIRDFRTEPMAQDPHATNVAILLAVKDGARFLGEQLESYVRQTHTDWSLHISDDGSSDGTVEIIKGFADRVSRPVTLRSGPCAGANSNFLSLLQDDSIDAEYFAFSDQDDVWFEDKLERAIAHLHASGHNQAALYCSRTELIDHEGRHIGFSTEFKKPPSFQNALVQSIAGGNTMLFNRAGRNLLKKAAEGGAVVVHDWMTYIAISAAGGKVFYDKRPSVKYRQHEHNLMGSNLSFGARSRRLKLLLKGQWRDWSSIHVKVLERMRPEIAVQNRQVLDSFVQMRSADWLLLRLWYLWKSGVYRQTIVGQIGMVAAAMLRKI